MASSRQIKFKMGDKVLVKKAIITPALVGKICRVKYADHVVVELEGSISHWDQGTDCLELIEAETVMDDTRSYLEVVAGGAHEI